MKLIELYTDGSCHTQLKIGGWAAILLIDDKKIILKEIISDTSHNRMELMAIVKSIDYIKTQCINFETINIYSDSQYVVNITQRQEKLKKNHFLTKQGVPIRNLDLVQKLIELIETNKIQFIKVIAHQKQTDTVNYNREVDKIVRKLVRIAVGNPK